MAPIKKKARKRRKKPSTLLTIAAAVQKASSVGVDAAFKPSKTRWLNTSSRFFEHQDTLDHLVACAAKTSSTDYASLCEYLSASVLPHTLASSSYLSECLNALLSGESEAAMHLAYYSELRSAFAILARHGIGIMLGNHFTVDASSAAHVTQHLGTHAACWPALKEWSETNSASIFLSQAISYRDIPLIDYLNMAGLSGSVTAIVPTWIKEWGLDLSIFSSDQKERNIASYRPSFAPLTFTKPKYYKALYKTVGRIWGLLNPPVFMDLDQYLIFEALKVFYKGQGISDETQILEKVKDVFRKLSLPEELAVNLSKSPNWRSIKKLISNDPSNTTPKPLQMLMRAAILHRLAIGASLDLINKTSQKPAVKAVLEKHLFNKLNINLENPKDLYADVRQVFDDNLAIEEHPLIALDKKEIGTICNMNSVAAWSLLPAVQV